MNQLLSTWPLPLIVVALGLPLLSTLILLALKTSRPSRSLLLLSAIAQLSAGLAILGLPEPIIRHIPVGGTLWTLHMDQAAGLWLTLSGSLFGLLTLSGTLSLAPHRQILLLLAATFTTAAALQDNLLWLLMLVSGIGWLTIAAVAEVEVPTGPNPARRWQDLPRWCGLFIVADLFAIGGMQLFVATLPHVYLSQLDAAQMWLHLAEREPALLNSAASLLWGMLVIRLGLYPGIGWLKSAATSTAATMCIVTLLFPLNQLIWFRLVPLMQFAPEARLMAAGLAAISLVILGFLTCFSALADDDAAEADTDSQRRLLLYLSAGWNAALCLCIVAGPAPMVSTIMFPLFAASGGLGLVLLFRMSPSSKLLAGLAACGTAASLPGFAACLGTAMQPADLPALATSLGWLTGLGQLLLWCGLFRLLRHSLSAHQQTARIFTATFIIALTGLAIAVNQGAIQNGTPLHWSILLAATSLPIAAMLGTGINQRWAIRSSSGDSSSLQSLSRLAAQEFYLDAILEQAIAYPMWCLQLVVTYLADGLFLRLMPAMAKLLGTFTGEALDELEEPASRTMHWEVVLLTTFALGLAVWIMG